MAGKVHYRNLHGMIANGIALIDAVRAPSETSENLVTLYFRADAPMDRIGLPRAPFNHRHLWSMPFHFLLRQL
ncbi:MAG: hypothetical protein EBV86_12160 [Marivivens sp.]|nr:hypothetical protein [Marivivens sp.]